MSVQELTYNEFFRRFMKRNVPVIVKHEIISSECSSFFENGNFLIGKFREQLGIKNEHQVPVYNCSKQYFNSHEKNSVSFKEFEDYWNKEHNESSEKTLLYLKDFHVAQEFPELDLYNVPQYFSSDWLNEYLLDTNKDDYRFVYIGVAGTWTPLHADVFGSYSWSANICGKKQWLLMPPNEENKLREDLGNLPLSISCDLLRAKGVVFHEIIQEANEILFVPSQWYHQVTNLTDVFSINHNWFNSCNVETILRNILKNYEEVKSEIADCSDMENFEEHCQIMLKSIFGMNFDDFVNLLSHIAEKRFNFIKNGVCVKIFKNFTLGHNHAVYDLSIIMNIFEQIIISNHIEQNIKASLTEKINTYKELLAK